MIRLADGDRSAIPLVYRALWPSVVRYCATLVGDATEAEDLAQSALLKLFEQAYEYDPEKSTRTWALTIAAWECRTYRKKRSRNERNVDKMARTQVRESSPDIEDQAWKHRAVEALKELIRDMPEGDRQALVDSFVRGLSNPIHRKRKQRVLARLRRRWREVYGDV